MCRYRIQATKKQIENTSSSRTATLLEIEDTGHWSVGARYNVYQIDTAEPGQLQCIRWIPQNRARYNVSERYQRTGARYNASDRYLRTGPVTMYQIDTSEPGQVQCIR